MTVRELLRLLHAFDPNSKIVDSGGYNLDRACVLIDDGGEKSVVLEFEENYYRPLTEEAIEDAT